MWQKKTGLPAVLRRPEMTAHFQETTEGLSVPHLMCWRTEETFTTARRCCGVFVILAPDIKLQTYLLTYLLMWKISAGIILQLVNLVGGPDVPTGVCTV